MKKLLTVAAMTIVSALAILSGHDRTAYAAEEDSDVKTEARAFLRNYQKELAALELRATLAQWQAAVSGKKEDFAATAAANLALRTYHSDAEAYKRLQGLIEAGDDLPRVQTRALQMAELSYRANQLPPDLLKQMVELSTEIERTFNTFRGELNGERLSNNALLEILGKETDSQKRQQSWAALKQVGVAVAPKLVELAKLRNRAAKHLGYDNFWQMRVRLQEHDPEQLLSIFEELDRLTREPFTKMKAKMDGELAGRFKIKPEQMMPWHYDNPFFQSPPPSAAVDLDEFYEKKSKEDIVEISRVFFADVGLPVEGILKRSDLFEREGKDQHAFCTSIDRADDVRILCNIKPTSEWMDTQLHELGHAVYDLGIDRRLPHNLREPTNPFTTEGVAMLFGALGKTPSWMIAYAGADKDRVAELSEAILDQRRREQLIFARWTLVMLNFEKAFYEDPEQDLNTLWWDKVERYQQLTRPADRDLPDWAAKPHFTIAPVYYHSYMLGELFAAQLRQSLAELAEHEGPISELSFNGRKDFGEFLTEKVFKPGTVLPWPRFVRRATGKPLSARYFAAEVTGN
ncbi:MAG: M2 family metallopeptidase [Candidatus Nealsonbacteria bacterium]|nr:M2 family metallopeptidase [Candidatus Nealsonbacteria bacterium]